MLTLALRRRHSVRRLLGAAGTGVGGPAEPATCASRKLALLQAATIRHAEADRPSETFAATVRNQEDAPGVVSGCDGPWVLTTASSLRSRCRTWTWCGRWRV